MPLVARHALTVYPVLRLFLIMDPTCDELSNNNTAFGEAVTGAYGWGPNCVLVNTVIDPGYVPVVVEVWDEPAVRPDGEPGLLAESSLQLPGGYLHCLQALDEDTQRGFQLPDGGGTYGVRVVGYHRDRSTGEFPRDPSSLDASNFPGSTEAYLFQVWQTSDEPRWDEDEDDY